MLALAASTYAFYDFWHYAREPADPKGVTQVLEVKAGMGLKAVSEVLTQANVIKDPLKFSLLARYKGYAKRIRAGEYALSAAMSPLAILDIMESGKVYLHRVTIPEGYNMQQIAEAFQKAGLADVQAFLDQARNKELAGSLGVAAETLEGYLFPETYYFPKNVTPKKIVSTMVQRFWSIFTPEFRARAEELQLSVHQVVTLASIIEKETGDPSERPLISSVFHNRLKKGMRLESDPTVIYGIDRFNGNLTRKHLETHTPYNTYTIRGLPPGPIANPGLKAIEAALFPAKTDYLYFVAKKDRTHQFSTNLEDHNRAVRKYQLKK